MIFYQHIAAAGGLIHNLITYLKFATNILYKLCQGALKSINKNNFYRKQFLREFSRLAIVVQQFHFDHVDAAVCRLQNALELRKAIEIYSKYIQ